MTATSKQTGIARLRAFRPHRWREERVSPHRRERNPTYNTRDGRLASKPNGGESREASRSWEIPYVTIFWNAAALIHNNVRTSGCRNGIARQQTHQTRELTPWDPLRSLQRLRGGFLTYCGVSRSQRKGYRLFCLAFYSQAAASALYVETD